MPYISPERRIEVIRYGAQNAGELNFAITRLLCEYLTEQGKDYQHINDCVGALEACKLEFVRRVVNPFEDLKILTNGDVYPVFERKL